MYNNKPIRNPYSSKKNGTRPNRDSLEGSGQLKRLDSYSSTGSSSVQFQSNASAKNREFPVDNGLRRAHLPLNECSDSNSFAKVAGTERNTSTKVASTSAYFSPRRERADSQNEFEGVDLELMFKPDTDLDSVAEPQNVKISTDKNPLLVASKPSSRNGENGCSALPENNSIESSNEENEQNSSKQSVTKCLIESFTNVQEKREGQGKKRRRSTCTGEKKNDEGAYVRENKQRTLTSFFESPNKKQSPDTKTSKQTSRKVNDVHQSILMEEHSNGKVSRIQTLTQCFGDLEDKRYRMAKENNTNVTVGTDVLQCEKDDLDETLDLSQEDLHAACSTLTQNWDADDVDDIEQTNNSDVVKSHRLDEGVDSYQYDPKGVGETARMYTKGDMWHCHFDDQKMYTIVGFILNGHTRKQAVCRVNKRLSKTFLGDDVAIAGASLEDYWIETTIEEPIALSLLKYKNTTTRPDLVRPAYRWEPSSNCSTGDATRVADERQRSGLSLRFGFAYIHRDQTNTRKKKVNGRPTVLDLFGGAGGMGTGLEKAGFNVTCTVEIDPCAAGYLEKNFRDNEVYNECVNGFLKCVEQGLAGYPRIGDFNHIHVSSPCPGFSGANREKDGGKNGLKNNELAYTWLRSIRDFQPDTASFENVTGLLHPKHIHYLKKMVKETLFFLGYSVRVCVLDASWYGDPQVRQRVIMFASKRGVPLALEPKATHGAGKRLAKVQTVRDCIKDLEHVAPTTGSGRVELENGVVLNHSIDGTDKKSESERIDPSAPVRTLYGQSTNALLHYSQNRGLTLRELARLQSFPDKHRFPSQRNIARKQIYNAVPIELAFAVGRSLMESYLVTHDN